VAAQKPLLVCGSGRTLFPDLEALGVTSRHDLADRFDVMAINDAGLAIPECQHWATYHSEKMLHWLMLRKMRMRNGVIEPDFMGTVTHSQRAKPGVKRVHVFQQAGGTSAFFGVQVGLEKLNYDRIILCGCPMAGTGRFLDSPWAKTHDYKVTDNWASWTQMHEQGYFRGHVFSMSGCTRELLGPPPENWYARPVAS
jgi:hypothetical protein